MPVIDGRLVCCSCGSDLGDAEDEFRDPNCPECERAAEERTLEDEAEEEALAQVEEGERASHRCAWFGGMSRIDW